MKKVLAAFLLLIPFVAQGQSIAVYDGPTIGVDIDTQTSTESYQGCWETKGVSWPSDGYNKYWLWLWEGEVDTGTVVYFGTYPFWPDPPIGFYENEVTITIPGSSCSPPLQAGRRYCLKVEARLYGEIPAASGQSDGVTIITGGGDTTAPEVVLPLPPTQSSTTFTVAWEGHDLESGIDYYQVQTRTGSGAWSTWISRTTRTSQSFTGNNGQTYSFRVTAYDMAGNSAFQEASTVVIASGASLSATATPASLRFSSGETSKSLTLNLTATGGAVALSSIREARSYPGWGTEEAPLESLKGTIAGGATLAVRRTVGLDDLQRAKALGTGTEGSFTLRFTVIAQSSQGAAVSCSIAIPVAVSGGPPSSLAIQQVALELPASPYYAGDIVEGARLLVTATGSGTVMGEVLVDGSTGWSSAPSFTASISGTSAIRIPGRLPTGSPGIHTVTARLSVPESITVEGTYTVSSEAAPFPPARLTLVPGVAELFDLKGSATATSNEAQGYEEYVFSGTAKMKLLSLGNVEATNDFTVNGLVVRYAQGSPGQPVIRGGTVDYDSAEAGLAPAVTFASGLLQVLAVHYAGNPNTPTDSITIDAGLSAGGSFLRSLPASIGGFLIDNLKGLVVKADGVQARSFSWSEAQSRRFDAFGVQFRIHDVDAGSPALAFGKDATTDRYFLGLSGSLAWNEKRGTSTEARKLTAFRDLRLYSDGSLNASFAFEPPVEIVPDYLALTTVRIAEEGGTFAMRMGGELRNLPVPLDRLGAVPFEIAFDAEGNAQGELVPVQELASGFSGHGLGGGDRTEWDLGLATLDLTYLGVKLAFAQGSFDRDHSAIRLGADFYLNLLKNPDGSAAQSEQKRLSFGELDGSGAFTGGIAISMDGDVAWHAPTNAAVVANKRLDLLGLIIGIDALGVEPSPFSFVFTGGLQLGLEGVEGRVNFQNLKIGLDGSFRNIASAVTGGSLRVLDVMSIAVGAISWSSQPSTLTFQADGTIGAGADRTFAATDRTVEVAGFFRMTGAAVNLGADGATLMSGGFQELTVYDPVQGERSFVLKNASLSGFGVTVKADVDYRLPQLSVAGTVALPGSISATVVGRIGTKDDEPSMGLFVAVEGMDIVVGPGVVLTEVGGGLFINPEQQDVDLVKRMARFESRALLDQKVAERGPQANPGGFGIMIVGGAAFAAADVVRARAMVTVTASYFNLDAEVDFADGLAKGDAYLAVGWRPAYAEGAFNVTVNFARIIRGTGNLQFYVYSDELWGVMGSVNVALLGADLASGQLFIGAPGFMLEAKLRTGVDIGLVSGSITFEGLVWYYTVPNPDTWGAYASVEVKGEVLWGLLSASAKIEGALIGSSELFIYAVGSVKFKICWVTVFKGSIWVTIGSNGIDGGKGRNDEYDELIDAARHMADAMKDARAQLDEALAAAKLALYQLSEAQQRAAGLALVERSGWFAPWLSLGFAALESTHWGTVIPQNMPQGVRAVWELVFGSGQQSLVQARTDLENLMQAINAGMTSLDGYHQAVVQRLDAYRDLLVEPLPSIEELGSPGNPFQGMRQATVSVGGASRTVASGFQIDETLASRKRAAFTSVREDFAQYQDRFIEQAGLIGDKLQELDRLLFQGDTTISALTSRYADLYTRMGEYLSKYLELQDRTRAFALTALGTMQAITEQKQVPGGGRVTVSGEAAILKEMEDKAAALNWEQLRSWNTDRLSLIGALLAIARAQGAEVSDPELAVDDPWLLFTQSGAEVWYRIPRAGFEAQAQLAPERKLAAIEAHAQSSEPFRTKWISASSLIATVFDRKADLSGILYEICDQLAHYGTGLLGAGGGETAAAGGMQVQGFAAESLSQLPTQVAGVSGSQQQGQTFTPAEQTAAAGIAVSTYFAGKRNEIAPYLEIPTITGFEGSVASTDALDAVLTLGFSATHPKGVAEYACRVVPQAGSWGGSTGEAAAPPLGRDDAVDHLQRQLRPGRHRRDRGGDDPFGSRAAPAALAGPREPQPVQGVVLPGPKPGTAAVRLPPGPGRGRHDHRAEGDDPARLPQCLDRRLVLRGAREDGHHAPVGSGRHAESHDDG